MDSRTFVHLFHILIVGGLFLYVGIAQTKIPKILYPNLLVFGLVIIVYHAVKAYKRLSDGKNPWVNYIHIFIVGPLLIYIGANKENTPRYCFELLLMLGFAAIGYHGYYLFNE